MAVATEMGVEFEEIRYTKNPPDEAALRDLIAKLELVEDDYIGNPDKVVEVLLAHPKLLQRPVIVTADKAIIGRPLGDQKAKERLNDLFS